MLPLKIVLSLSFRFLLSICEKQLLIVYNSARAMRRKQASRGCKKVKPPDRGVFLSRNKTKVRRNREERYGGWWQRATPHISPDIGICRGYFELSSALAIPGAIYPTCCARVNQ